MTNFTNLLLFQLMLIQNYQHSVISLLLLVTFLSLSSSKAINQTIIPYSLKCNQLPPKFNIGIRNFEAGSLFLIKMQLSTKDGLPIAMSINDNPSLFYYLKQDNIQNNNNIDVDSILLNKDTQVMYYQSAPGQQVFFVSAEWIFVSIFKYKHNLDRPVQYGLDQNKRDGNNLDSCLTPINFTIQIIQYDYSLSNESLYLSGPLSPQQCKGGKFNYTDYSCVCQTGYAMLHCDVHVQKIGNTDELIRDNIRVNDKKYYYYEYTGENQKIAIEIGLKFSSGEEYSYNEEEAERSSKVNMLVLVQPMTDKIRVPTAYNQYNPNQIWRLEMRRGERLVMSIYRPRWSRGEEQLQLKLTEYVQPKSLLTTALQASLIVSPVLVFLVVFSLCWHRRYMEVFVENEKPIEYYYCYCCCDCCPCPASHQLKWPCSCPSQFTVYRQLQPQS